MEAEAIEQIKALVRMATPKVIDRLPNQSKGQTLLFDLAAMAYDTVEVKVDESLQFEDFDSLMASVNPSATFWVSQDQACWSHGFDRATLPLKLSEQIQMLTALEKHSPEQKQEALCHSLRTAFREMVIPETLAGTLASITWKINEDGKSAVQQGSRSLGRSIEARVENRDNIPDTIVFTVPIWATGGRTPCSITAKIVADLMVNPQTQTIRITPVAGSTQKAIQEAVRQLHTIACETLPDMAGCYIGKPTELK